MSKIPRFPPRQKRADGTFGCRGCGSDIPKGRQTWCSRECVKKFDPFHVKLAVRARAEGKCEMPYCGLPTRGEFDHIIPHSEGGKFIVENIRHICSDCHKARTKKWWKEKMTLHMEATLPPLPAEPTWNDRFSRLEAVLRLQHGEFRFSDSVISRITGITDWKKIANMRAFLISKGALKCVEKGTAAGRKASRYTFKP